MSTEPISTAAIAAYRKALEQVEKMRALYAPATQWGQARIVAFQQFVPDPNCIALYRRMGARRFEREVIAIPAGCQNSVRVSPDRTVVGCTARIDAEQTTTFLVAPIGGGSPRAVLRVADGEALSSFWSWLPDSRGALLVRTDIRGKDALWHVPLEGTPRRFEIDLSQWAHDGHFHVQPGGRHLAFLANAGDPGAEIWALENVLPKLSATK